MYFRNVTKEDLETALAEVNKRYEDNIIFREIEPAGRRWRATLKVKDSTGPGHKNGFSYSEKRGRYNRTCFACWHVHGHFFDALYRINPAVEIRTGRMVYKNGENWQDYEVGGGRWISEMCDCEEA